MAEIVPAADPASRTVTVKLDLPPAPAMRSGLYGRARFALGRAEVLLVPARAVVERGQLTTVFVVGDDQRARLRLVTVGRRRGELVEALAGLAANERVAAEGVEGLKDGQRVEVRE